MILVIFKNICFTW